MKIAGEEEKFVGVKVMCVCTYTVYRMELLLRVRNNPKENGDLYYYRANRVCMSAWQ
jgi:hypothetical protein